MRMYRSIKAQKAYISRLRKVWVLLGQQSGLVDKYSLEDLYKLRIKSIEIKKKWYYLREDFYDK